jgi:hypothetical protein
MTTNKLNSVLREEIFIRRNLMQNDEKNGTFYKSNARRHVL